MKYFIFRKILKNKNLQFNKATTTTTRAQNPWARQSLRTTVQPVVKPLTTKRAPIMPDAPSLNTPAPPADYVEPVDLENLKQEIAEFAQLAAEQSAQEVESKVKLR